MIDGNEKTVSCSIIIQGKISGEKRVETLADAASYLLARPSGILGEDCTIRLPCGYYELSLSELRQLCVLPDLLVIGSGVHGQIPTVIRIFDFRHEDLAEISELAKRLWSGSFRVEV